MRLINALVLMFALVLGVSFALLNSESIVVNYYLGVQKIPLSVLVLIILIMGIGIGLLVSLPPIFKLKMELRRLRREHH